jgi:hypothetical protein
LKHVLNFCFSSTTGCMLFKAKKYIHGYFNGTLVGLICLIGCKPINLNPKPSNFNDQFNNFCGYNRHCKFLSLYVMTRIEIYKKWLFLKPFFHPLNPLLTFKQWMCDKEACEVLWCTCSLYNLLMFPPLLVVARAKLGSRVC